MQVKEKKSMPLIRRRLMSSEPSSNKKRKLKRNLKQRKSLRSKLKRLIGRKRRAD